MAVRSLEDGIECFEDIAVPVFERGIEVEHIEYGLVVFVHEDHGASAGLPVDGFEDFDKTPSQVKELCSGF